MICSLLPSCPVLTSDSQDLIYTTNLFSGRAPQYFLSRFPALLQLLQVLLPLNYLPPPLANGDVHALCLPSVLLLNRTTQNGSNLYPKFKTSHSSSLSVVR